MLYNERIGAALKRLEFTGYVSSESHPEPIMALQMSWSIPEHESSDSLEGDDNE